MVKKLQKPEIYAWICTAGGIAAMLLRLWVLQTGMSDRHLIDNAHPGNVLSWVVTGVVMLPTLWLFLQQPKCSRCTAAPSPVAAIGTLAGAAGMAIAAIPLLTNGQNSLAQITGVMGILSALAMVFMACCRFSGRKSHYLISCITILFLCMLPIQLYQNWSAERQLPLYFFQLVGSVLLMVWSYQRAALSAGIGSWRSFVLVRWAGTFFCFAAAAGSDFHWFYACMGVCVLLDSMPVQCVKETDHDDAAA